MNSEKHSVRVEGNEHPKTHLAVLHENLTESYKGKNKVVAPADILNAEDSFEFIFGEEGINSFSQGICKKMFKVDDYSGLRSDQIAFVNHLIFMMAQHFNLNMNRVNKSEKFLFDFTGGVAKVTMFDGQGKKVIDNQPIQAGAITKAMEMLGEERLHADAQIKARRKANPSRKSLVEMATEWDGLVDTLQVFGERISVEARKEMLQGLDVFDETVDTAIRADIDTINGINKYLKLHFEVEKKLSGSALNAAMEKHRVNLDGTGYADTPGESGPQSVAWVRFIRHDIFEYDVPFTDEQISSAQSDLESEQSEGVGSGVEGEIEVEPSVEDLMKEKLKSFYLDKQQYLNLGVKLAEEAIDTPGVYDFLAVENPDELTNRALEKEMYEALEQNLISLRSEILIQEAAGLIDEDLGSFKNSASMPDRWDMTVDVVQLGGEELGEDGEAVPTLDSTPSKMREYGLDVNMSAEELDRLKASVASRIASRFAEKQGEMMEDNPDFKFTFMPSKRGELGNPPLPYIYMDFSLDGDSTEWSTSRSGTVDGKRGLAKRFSKKSGVELRNVEEYLAMRNIEEDLDSIFGEVDVYMLEHAVAVAQSQVEVSEPLEETVDVKSEVVEEEIEVKPKVRLRPKKVIKEVLKQIDFDLVGLRLKDSLGANAQHVDSISVDISKDTFEYDEASGNWVCDVRWGVNFNAIDSVYGMIGRIVVPGDEFGPEVISEDYLFEQFDGEIKRAVSYEVVTNEVVTNLEAVNAALNAGEEVQPIDLVVTPEGSDKYGGLPKLKRYKVSAIDEIRLPAYADFQYEQKDLSPREITRVAEFNRQLDDMKGYGNSSSWKGIDRAFEKVNSPREMKFLWRNADRGELTAFYKLGVDAAENLGDFEAMHERLQLLKQLDSTVGARFSALESTRGNMVHVSLSGEKIKPTVFPFEPSLRAVIDGANTSLFNTGKFEGVLPKLDNGAYYTVTVNGEDKVLDLHESLE